MDLGPSRAGASASRRCRCRSRSRCSRRGARPRGPSRRAGRGTRQPGIQPRGEPRTGTVAARMTAVPHTSGEGTPNSMKPIPARMPWTHRHHDHGLERALDRALEVVEDLPLLLLGERRDRPQLRLEPAAVAQQEEEHQQEQDEVDDGVRHACRRRPGAARSRRPRPGPSPPSTSRCDLRPQPRHPARGPGSDAAARPRTAAASSGPSSGCMRIQSRKSGRLLHEQEERRQHRQEDHDRRDEARGARRRGWAGRRGRAEAASATGARRSATHAATEKTSRNGLKTQNASTRISARTSRSGVSRSRRRSGSLIAAASVAAHRVGQLVDVVRRPGRRGK